MAELGKQTIAARFKTIFDKIRSTKDRVLSSAKNRIVKTFDETTKKFDNFGKNQKIGSYIERQTNRLGNHLDNFVHKVSKTWSRHQLVTLDEALYELDILGICELPKSTDLSPDVLLSIQAQWDNHSVYRNDVPDDHEVNQESHTDVPPTSTVSTQTSVKQRVMPLKQALVYLTLWIPMSV